MGRILLEIKRFTTLNEPEYILFCNTTDRIILNNVIEDINTGNLLIELYHKDYISLIKHFKDFCGAITFNDVLEYIREVE